MELHEMNDKAIDFIVDNIQTDELSDWEQGFVESVADQWGRTRSLSDKQKLKLGEIWDRQE